jgi:hypothetical protein
MNKNSKIKDLKSQKLKKHVQDFYKKNINGKSLHFYIL